MRRLLNSGEDRKSLDFVGWPSKADHVRDGPWKAIVLPNSIDSRY